jgi:hypothetical protein
MHEQCLRCDHFNHQRKRCDRVLKAKMFLGFEGGRLSGDLNIETAPGLLTKALEDDLAEFLSHWMPTVVERWKGWEEVLRLHEGNECAAEQPSKCIQEFGVRVLTVVPTKEPGEKDPVDDIPGYLKTEGYSGF